MQAACRQPKYVKVLPSLALRGLGEGPRLPPSSAPRSHHTAALSSALVAADANNVLAIQLAKREQLPALLKRIKEHGERRAAAARAASS